MLRALTMVIVSKLIVYLLFFSRDTLYEIIINSVWNHTHQLRRLTQQK